MPSYFYIVKNNRGTFINKPLYLLQFRVNTPAINYAVFLIASSAFSPSLYNGNLK